MKKITALVLALMLLMAFALGCQQKPAEQPAEPAMQEEAAPAEQPAEPAMQEEAAPAESAH